MELLECASRDALPLYSAGNHSRIFYEYFVCSFFTCGHQFAAVLALVLGLLYYNTWL